MHEPLAMLHEHAHSAGGGTPLRSPRRSQLRTNGGSHLSGPAFSPASITANGPRQPGAMGLHDAGASQVGPEGASASFELEAPSGGPGSKPAPSGVPASGVTVAGSLT